MGQLTQNGYTIKNLSDWRTDVVDLFLAAFGQALVTSDDTPQGILITRIAELLYNCDLDGLNVYNQMNVTTASGVFLDFLGSNRGVFRKSGTPQTLICLLTVSTNTTFLDTQNIMTSDGIYQYTHPTINLLTVDDQNYIPGVSNILTLTLSGSGDPAVTVGDTLQTVDYIPSITNILVNTVTSGKEPETDVDYRLRLLSQRYGYIGTLNYILMALREVDGVETVGYLENDTANYDNNIQVPAYSTEFLVSVSSDAPSNVNDEIAYTILDSKAGINATPTYGNTTVTVLYPRTGLIQQPRTIHYSRPTNILINVNIELSAKENNLVSIADKTTWIYNITNYINNLEIGQDISYSTIFGIVNTIPTNDIPAVKFRSAGYFYVDSNATSFATLVDPDDSINIVGANIYNSTLTTIIGTVVSYDPITEILTDNNNVTYTRDTSLDPAWQNFTNYAIGIRERAQILLSDAQITFTVV